MGTNYYLRVGGCPNPCAHCRAPELIHLGKSSAGWTFSFRAYPEAGDIGRDDLGTAGIVSDFAAWRRLLNLGPIEDEYGQPVAKDELLAKIESKRGGRDSLYGSDFRDAAGNRFTSAEFS